MKLPFLAAAATVVVALPVHAAIYTYSYASDGAAPLAASGRIYTSNHANSFGTFDIVGITRIVDGDGITALTPNPNQPNPASSSDGLFNYDNTFTNIGSRPINDAGVLFTSAGHEYNLFSDSATKYELYQATGGNVSENSVGSLIVAQVPEPAS